MPYKIVKVKRGYFVEDNSGMRLSKKPFKTKEQARKQEIAVILSEHKRTKKPLKYYFG